MDDEGTDLEARMDVSLEPPVAFGAFVEDLVAGLARRGTRLQASPEDRIT